MIQPETQYTSVGNDRVAYQVLGEGPRDLLITAGFAHHLEIMWEDPALTRFYRRLASFSRLIRFDRRGTGLSDKAGADGGSDIEHWIQDCAAVLDATASRSAVIMGGSTFDNGQLILQFVDRYPDRCSGLILINNTACLSEQPDYPQGHSSSALEEVKEFWRRNWGRPEFCARFLPSQAKNEAVMRWVAKVLRSGASPGALIEKLEVYDKIDSRSLLSRVRVPTLVFACTGYQFVPIGQSRYLAEHIPGARFVELPGSDGMLAWEVPEPSLGLIEEFITGRRHGAEADRIATAILFTDIVNSTRRASELGDAAWRHLLERHDRNVREQVDIHRGRPVEVTGDGTLARFDSASRALECALALRAEMAKLGIAIRAGLHFAEVELREDGRIGGLAVHIGARVMSLAGRDEILISRTVRDILLGSRFEFEEHGTHELKGVPDRWQVYLAGGRLRP